jgi:hypothetical protein
MRGVSMTMKRRFGGLPRSVIGLVVFSVLAAFTMADALAASVAKAVKVAGDVTVTHNGSDTSVKVDTTFEVGDVVETGRGARLRLEFIDGSVMSFAERTTIKIEQFDYNAGDRSRNVLLGLAEGIVNAVATKSPTGAFSYRIHSGDVYSAVRGTEWFADTEDAPLRVAVLTGQVEVGAAAGQPAQVPAGNYVDATPQGPGPVRPTPSDMLSALKAAVADVAAPKAPDRNGKNGGGGRR